LRKNIEKEKDLTVIAEACDGEEALKLAKETLPDIVIMDITKPEMDGIAATKKIKKLFPDIRVIGLSTHENEDLAREMLNAGASAHLTKSEAFETLPAIIRSEVTAEK
jgi:DNA-binding NarL/FixJ family response regulator